MKKNLLNYENLMNVNFDGESYELEFQEDGKSYFIRVDARDHEEAATNENYFDDKELVEKIIAEAEGIEEA